MGELPYIIGALASFIIVIYVVLGIVYMLASIIVAIKEGIDESLSKYYETNHKLIPHNSEELMNVLLFLGLVVLGFSFVLFLIDEIFLS